MTRTYDAADTPVVDGQAAFGGAAGLGCVPGLPFTLLVEFHVAVDFAGDGGEEVVEVRVVGVAGASVRAGRGARARRSATSLL
jgi:hypothetical protein